MFSSPSREQPTYLPPSEQKRKPKKDASLTTSSCERHISECSVLCSKLVLFWELNQVLGFAAACESKNRRHQTLYTTVNLCDLHAQELKTHPLSSSWTKCEILLFVFWLRTRPMRTKVKRGIFCQNLLRLIKGLSKNYVIADGKLSKWLQHYIMGGDGGCSDPRMTILQRAVLQMITVYHKSWGDTQGILSLKM